MCRRKSSVPGGVLLLVLLHGILVSASEPGPEAGDLEEEIADFAELDLEQLLNVVFTASKHKQSILWSPSAITVFTRADIRSSGAVNLPDLLRRVPGFDVYEMKPSFPVVGARALTDDSNNLVLVLVDGREALIEMMGFPAWAALTIDLDEIERVEVIRGPGSTLYGASAFAGVVSITTVAERPQASGDVLLLGGPEGTRRLFGRVRDSWDLGPGNLSFSASLGSEGRNSPSDRRDNIQQVYLRSHGYVRYQQGDRLDLSLHAGLSHAAGPMFMVVGDFDADPFINHYEMAQARVGFTDRLTLKTQIYHIRFYGEVHFRTTVTAGGLWLANLSDLVLDMNSYDGQLQLDYQASDDLLLMAGANLRYTHLDSDTLVPQELSETRGAVFVHAQWNPLDSLQLTGGLRLDMNTDTPEALSPRAVVVFRPWANHALRLGYGLAFRKPAFTENKMHLLVEEYNPAFPEVIEKLATTVGNEKLINEKLHSIEAGWRARFCEDRLQLSLDFYYNVYLNMIYFKSQMEYELGRPDIMDSIFSFLNADTSVTVIGSEAEVSWRPGEKWLLWANLGLREKLEDRGESPAEEPLLRLNLGGRWSPGEGLFVDLALHYVSAYEMPFQHPEMIFEAPEKVALGDSLLVIGLLGYRLTDLGPFELEGGLSGRIPIGGSFREYPGVSLPRTVHSVTAADHVGEWMVRLISFYLRGSY